MSHHPTSYSVLPPALPPALPPLTREEECRHSSLQFNRLPINYTTPTPLPPTSLPPSLLRPKDGESEEGREEGRAGLQESSSPSLSLPLPILVTGEYSALAKCLRERSKFQYITNPTPWITVHKARVVPIEICLTSIRPKRMTMMALRGIRKMFITPRGGRKGGRGR